MHLELLLINLKISMLTETNICSVQNFLRGNTASDHIIDPSLPSLVRALFQNNRSLSGTRAMLIRELVDQVFGNIVDNASCHAVHRVRFDRNERYSIKHLPVQSGRLRAPARWLR